MLMRYIWGHYPFNLNPAFAPGIVFIRGKGIVVENPAFNTTWFLSKVLFVTTGANNHKKNRTITKANPAKKERGGVGGVTQV